MSDLGCSSGVGTTALTGKISNCFFDRGCVGVLLHTGTLQAGDTITVFKSDSYGSGMGSQSADDFEHTQVADSIQVGGRPVSRVTVVEEEGGKKYLDVMFVGEDNPTRQDDRRCAIKVTRMPPNSAEVTLAQ